VTNHTHVCDRCAFFVGLAGFAAPATIRRVARAYAPRHIVPGHGTIAGDPIAHATALADAAAANRLAPGRR
jgi:hypothetical protein